MPSKSFQLNWDKENDTAQIVCTNPDFELSKVCFSPYDFDVEIKRLQDELIEVSNEGRAKFTEFVRSARFKK